MLREAKNVVEISGYLSEMDIEPKNYVKNGATVEAIGGSIKIRVIQSLGGDAKPTVLEVPVHLFSGKYTKSGAINPSYKNIKELSENAVSIAAAGGENGADWVRIKGARLGMNEYYTQDGRLVSFPRIQASFVTRTRKDGDSQAVFRIEMMVVSKTEEVDREGNETGRIKVIGAVPMYGGKVDAISFYTGSPRVAEAISQYWDNGKTYTAVGRLNFSAKTEKTQVPSDFGEVMVTERTVNVSEALITGGSQTPLDEANEFQVADIQAGLAERKARLEADRAKQAAKATEVKVDLPFGTGTNDFGF